MESIIQKGGHAMNYILTAICLLLFVILAPTVYCLHRKRNINYQGKLLKYKVIVKEGSNNNR